MLMLLLMLVIARYCNVCPLMPQKFVEKLEVCLCFLQLIVALPVESDAIHIEWKHVLFESVQFVILQGYDMTTLQYHYIRGNIAEGRNHG